MSEKKHSNKMVAPIVITIILVLYYAMFIGLCIIFQIPLILKILFAIGPLILGGVSIYVLIERIEEIRSGEEDDLSKY